MKDRINALAWRRSRTRLIDIPANVRLIFYVNGVAIIVRFDYGQRPTTDDRFVIIINYVTGVRRENAK